jgi:hypothetical protein
MSGSFKGFVKYDSATGAYASFTESILNSFLPIFKDNGAGSIVKTAQSDDEMICIVQLDKRRVTAAEKVVNLIFAAVIEGVSPGIPLKGVSPLDITWKAGQSVLPCIYERLLV